MNSQAFATRLFDSLRRRLHTARFALEASEVGAEKGARVELQVLKGVCQGGSVVVFVPLVVVLVVLLVEVLFLVVLLVLLVVVMVAVVVVVAAIGAVVAVE